MKTIKEQFIKQNLFIITDEKLNKFIKSYNTIVASIIGDEIICNGCYSKTTTNHINYISTILNKKVIKSNDKPIFVLLFCETKKNQLKNK
jgi:hypothetical protein